MFSVSPETSSFPIVRMAASTWRVCPSGRSTPRGMRAGRRAALVTNPSSSRTRTSGCTAGRRPRNACGSTRSVAEVDGRIVGSGDAGLDLVRRRGRRTGSELQGRIPTSRGAASAASCTGSCVAHVLERSGQSASRRCSTSHRVGSRSPGRAAGARSEPRHSRRSTRERSRERPPRMSSSSPRGARSARAAPDRRGGDAGHAGARGGRGIPYDEWLEFVWDNPLFTREGSFGAVVDGASRGRLVAARELRMGPRGQHVHRHRPRAIAAAGSPSPSSSRRRAGPPRTGSR